MSFLVSTVLLAIIISDVAMCYLNLKDRKILTHKTQSLEALRCNGLKTLLWKAACAFPRAQADCQEVQLDTGWVDSVSNSTNYSELQQRTQYTFPFWDKSQNKISEVLYRKRSTVIGCLHRSCMMIVNVLISLSLGEAFGSCSWLWHILSLMESLAIDCKLESERQT